MIMPPPVAHGRAATISSVIDYVRAIEDHLGVTLPSEVVARRGPRYQNLKDAMIDLYRVYETLVVGVKTYRDNDPQRVVACLIALAGQALKIADDTAAAADRRLGLSSVNVETSTSILFSNDND